MFYFFSKLIIILAMVICNEGRERLQPRCQYDIKLTPGKKQWIASPNYSGNYPRGASCKWSVSSPQQINLTCNIFDMPRSPNCRSSYLKIYVNGTGKAKKWCGDSRFSVKSNGNKLRIFLESSRYDRSGKFLCSVEPVCECGKKNPMRIYDGHETGVNEYPMMACIVYTEWNKSQCSCGAVLINAKQVLTAAHCVKYRKMRETKVLVGEHDTRISSETKATRLLRASSFQIPTDYVAGKFNHDIALVTTKETIDFNWGVSPVCLPYRHKDSFVGFKVDILGWGAHQPAGGSSPTLYKATTSVIRNDVCHRMYPDLTFEHMCTQHRSRDSCVFDSGGPIMWQSTATRRLILTGIISEGPFCGNGQPTKNTRVSKFIDWIDSQAPPVVAY